MRVLYIIDSLAPGGAERSLAALAPAYRARGIDLEVAYLRERAGVQAELEAAGAQLVSLDGRGGRAGWMRRAMSHVRARRPELVHTTLFEADVVGRVAARLARVPVVSSLVNEEYGPEHLANPQLRRWKIRAVQVVDAATARLAVRLHAVSTPVAETMARHLRVPRARIEVIPRGRDPHHLGERTDERRTRVRRSLGVDERDRVVLAVARQDYQKGLDVLLESLPILRGRCQRARLVVAGRGGDQTPLLERRLRELSLENDVRLLGERRDVPDLLCAADTFVLPSRREGFPGSVLEAMALQVPVVVTDLPTVRELVDDRCAWIAPPDSPDSLAVALMEALGERERVAPKVAAARARFLSEFTIDRVADRMIAFYERALAPAPR